MTLTQLRKKMGEDGAMARMDTANSPMRAELPARVDDDV